MNKNDQNIDFDTIDAYILDCLHHLEFGTFERVDDGKSRLLEYWWDQWKDKFHELVLETTSGLEHPTAPESKEGKVEDEEKPAAKK
jgi:hypothetical protein